MQGLTPKQFRVLQFIKQFIAKNGYSPSYEEIGVGVCVSSNATVANHVRNLVKRGHLLQQPNQRRSLMPIGENPAKD